MYVSTRRSKENTFSASLYNNAYPYVYHVCALVYDVPFIYDVHMSIDMYVCTYTYIYDMNMFM